MKYSLAFMDIEGMSDTIYFDSLSELGAHIAHSEADYLLMATINKLY